MDYKVHWIIDGIMNVDANSKEDAEKIVQEKLQNFVKNSDDLMNFSLQNLYKVKLIFLVMKKTTLYKRGMTILVI